MFDPQSQTLQVVTRRWAITVCASSAFVLGILTLHWMTERRWQSSASAAEAPPANGAAAAEKDDRSDQPRNEKPVRTPTVDAPAIEFFPQPTKYEARIIEALDKPTSIEWSDLGLEDCV